MTDSPLITADPWPSDTSPPMFANHDSTRHPPAHFCHSHLRPRSPPRTKVRAGVLAARGAYDPSLARAFLGLEPDGSIRPGGRFFTYCAGLPAAAHRPLAAAAGRAITALAALPHHPAPAVRDTLALTLLTLAELAAAGAGTTIAAAQQRASHWYAVKG